MLPCLPARDSESRFTARVAAITTECYFAFKIVIRFISLLWMGVRESQKSFLIYDELPVNLQLQSVFFCL